MLSELIAFLNASDVKKELTVICNIESFIKLLEKLRILVDSAEFKQNEDPYNFKQLNITLTIINQFFHEYIANDRFINTDRINFINHAILKIKIYYKWLKDCLQSIEDLNRRIASNLAKPISDKIGKLLIDGALPISGKLSAGKLLSQIKKNAPTAETTSFSAQSIVKNFIKLFVEYAACINDRTNLEQKLHLLQDNIIYRMVEICGRDSLKFYFELFMDAVIKKPDSEVVNWLLKSFVKHPLSLVHFKTESEYYVVKCSNFLSVIDKSVSDKYINHIATIILYFPKEAFKSFFEANIDEQLQCFFKSIYKVWVNIFINLEHNNNDLRNQVLDNFHELFVLLHEKNRLYNFMVQCLDNDVLEQTISILKHKYNQNSIVENLRLGNCDDLINCFDQLFFKIFLNKIPNQLLLINNQTPEMLLRFILHLGSYDRTLTSYCRNEEQEYIQIEQLANMLAKAGDYYVTKRHIWLVFQALINFPNVGSWQLRFNSVMYALEQINLGIFSYNVLNESFIKIITLKTLVLNSDNSVNHKFFQRLAKHKYIHLLKQVMNPKDLIAQLIKYNKNFESYYNQLTKMGIKFDANQLTEEFNIPFYLSFAKLYETTRVGDHGLIMLMLFKIFAYARDDYNNKDIESYRYEFERIVESVRRVLDFYNDLETRVTNMPDFIKNCYEQLKEETLKLITDGFSNNQEESLVERSNKARLIIDNAINYKPMFVNEVIQKEMASAATIQEQEQAIKCFFEEIKSILKTMLGRNCRNLTEWVESSGSIGEKISFACARRRYSEAEFIKWFVELNNNRESEENLRTSLAKISEVREHLESNKTVFDKINIQNFQYNQECALSLIYHDLMLNRQNNIFMQLGTGQGKSLVIAETARKILTSDQGVKRVFVITCYSHLANRDYKKFEPYFKYFGINSICCSKEILTDEMKMDPDVLMKQQVIYTDLETYFKLIRNERFKLLDNGTSINFPDPSESAVIMDEFDSLVLDSDEINQLLYAFPVEGAIGLDINNKLAVRQLFDEDFIQKMEQQLHRGIFDNWYALQLWRYNKNPNGYTLENSLGLKQKFANSFLESLKRDGLAQFVHCYLSPLTFYKQFKYIIGFSGSITESNMLELKKVLSDEQNQAKTFSYYEVPPFYGIKNLEKNRVFANNPGKICNREEEFVKEVTKEVEEKHKTGRPILIFSDIAKKRSNGQKSDFDLVKESLEQAAFIDRKQLYLIEDEKDVEKIPYIGKNNAITLATRVLARGADIKVDGHIKEGLHLLLTYYPPRKNIYTQMLGRTARQDEKGSYSEITMDPANYKEFVEVKLNNAKKLHEISEYFFGRVGRNTQNMRQWFLFMGMLSSINFTEDLQTLKEFINNNLLSNTVGFRNRPTF
jgi:hypothetical protein